MKGMSLFITGTDTSVGKTRVTTHLIERLRSAGINAVGMKPIECGGREDAKAIFSASGGISSGLTLDEVNPISLPEPLAPAAATVPHHIDLAQIRAGYKSLSDRFDCIIVEGAGGWLVPLDEGRTMADLAIELALPVLIVAANRLGALNHTLLTVSAIEKAGLVCRGIFLNDFGAATDLSRESNGRVLRKMLPNIRIFEMDFDGIIEFF